MKHISRISAVFIALTLGQAEGVFAQQAPSAPPGPFQSQGIKTPRLGQAAPLPNYWGNRQILPYWMQNAPGFNWARPAPNTARLQSRARTSGSSNAQGGFNGGFGFSGATNAQLQTQARQQARYLNQARTSWGAQNQGRPAYGASNQWSQGYGPASFFNGWPGFYGTPAVAPFGYGAPWGYASRPAYRTQTGGNK